MRKAYRHFLSCLDKLSLSVRSTTLPGLFKSSKSSSEKSVSGLPGPCVTCLFAINVVAVLNQWFCPKLPLCQHMAFYKGILLGHCSVKGWRYGVFRYSGLQYRGESLVRVAALWPVRFLSTDQIWCSVYQQLTLACKHCQWTTTRLKSRTSLMRSTQEMPPETWVVSQHCCDTKPDPKT